MESTGGCLAEPGIKESHGEHMRMACRARHKGEPWRAQEDVLQSQA